ncbi:hypothetical protein I7I53_00960 [Histoplasma capsulatum var. duboisii H88]|uniref:Uncharacterized protein n=1 Tax=Ajellomyces capsulatus (strain H88) TaxID=544711 RepID=A0A8A1LM09_AJEC8|nr:hypothetical protein I7I53_00960 [Histoplasma capsulatum var. duboisii H88]
MDWRYPILARSRYVSEISRLINETVSRATLPQRISNLFVEMASGNLIFIITASCGRERTIYP